MDKFLEQCRTRLLDMGKRNKMLNYRDVKLGSLEIVYPQMENIFFKVTHGGVLEFFDFDGLLKNKCKNKGRAFNALEDNDIFDLGQKVEISNEEFDMLVKEAVIKCLPKNILSFKKNFSTTKILKTMQKTASLSLTEKGINILYLAFGFVKWKDKTVDSYEYKSPLILIPVTIENNSIVNPFKIKMYEEEIIINPTLRYKFKSDFGIELPDIDEDDNILEYLEKVQTLTEKVEGKVAPETVLSFFSFNKMNMYIDLKQNEDHIIKNPIIASLVGKNVDALPNVGDGKIDIQNSEEDLDIVINRKKIHNVVDADSSQIEAILMAKSGKSFVLQGPPGTGKSQTITNIIAEFLADKKKVLFVSEKLAALQVVYRNLKKAGLHDYCLELHSHKANKKEVVSNIAAQLKKEKVAVSDNVATQSMLLKSSQDELNSYAKALHEKNTMLGLSPYEIYSELSKLVDVMDMEFLIKDIQNKGKSYLTAALNALNSFEKHSENIGYEYKKNAWYGFDKIDCSYESRLELKKNLTKCVEGFKKFDDVAKNIIMKYNIDIMSLKDIKNFVVMISFLGKVKNYNCKFFNKNEREAFLKVFESQIAVLTKLQEVKKKILDSYSEKIFELDAPRAFKAFANNYKSKFRFFNKEYRKDKKLLMSCRKRKGYKPNYGKLLIDLRVLDLHARLIAEYNEYGATIQSYIGDGYKAMQTDYKRVLEDVSGFKDVSLMFTNLGIFQNMSSGDFKSLQRNIVAYATEAVIAINDTSIELASIQRHFDSESFNFSTRKISEVLQKLLSCVENFDILTYWVQFIDVEKEIKRLELDEFLEKYLENNLPLEQVETVFLKQFYLLWIDYIINSNSVLASFNKVNHDKSVEVYKKQDKLGFEIAKAQIKEIQSKLRPNLEMMSNGSQVSILFREAEKKQRIMPVRLLFEKAPDIVQTLKPCFLMSPLSVSTYLNPDFIEFDVVIFDEASQIFPEDALGAMYRAKQVVIVGDSKQMPPSNFFNATLDDTDENDYDESVSDFESILDMTAVCFNQKRLKWHYRSKAEQLIAFSNINFYNGELVSFPSCVKDRPSFGVEYYYVDGGLFNRTTKTNTKEAERIADLVIEHFKETPDRTLGVVAFSQSQQDAIERALNKKRMHNKEYDSLFQTTAAEEFFIKNLETVQGDERDTIILGVGYGYDEAGKFYHNFGPLNRVGGERRLNVAITRAKVNVKLVASVHGSDISLSKTNAVGAKLLKGYLDFAECGAGALNKEAIATDECEVSDGFQSEVRDFLVEKGFEVYEKVGFGGYRVDLAIKHPKSDEFVVAIECDGKMYKKGKTTRDRDRLREEILERQGWQFYRLWSTDWIKNKTVSKDNLANFVSNAIVQYDNNKENGKNIESATLENANLNFEVSISKKDEKKPFKEYVDVDWKQIKRAGQSVSGYFTNVMREIINNEAPISKEYLLGKICGLFAREKVTDYVREAFETQIKKVDFVVLKNGFYYNALCNKVEFRIPKKGEKPRALEHICIEELQDGLMRIISQNVAAQKEGLFKTMSALLGYPRMSEKIENTLSIALDLLVDKGYVVLENDSYLISQT